MTAPLLLMTRHLSPSSFLLILLPLLLFSRSSRISTSSARLPPRRSSSPIWRRIRRWRCSRCRMQAASLWLRSLSGKPHPKSSKVWEGRLWKRFWKMFSDTCSSTGRWAELQLPCCPSKQNILQNLSHNLPPQTVQCSPLISSTDKVTLMVTLFTH